MEVWDFYSGFWSPRRAKNELGASGFTDRAPPPNMIQNTRSGKMHNSIFILHMVLYVGIKNECHSFHFFIIITDI